MVVPVESEQVYPLEGIMTWTFGNNILTYSMLERELTRVTVNVSLVESLRSVDYRTTVAVEIALGSKEGRSDAATRP